MVVPPLHEITILLVTYMVVFIALFLLLAVSSLIFLFFTKKKKIMTTLLIFFLFLSFFVPSIIYMNAHKEIAIEEDILAEIEEEAKLKYKIERVFVMPKEGNFNKLKLKRETYYEVLIDGTFSDVTYDRGNEENKILFSKE